MLILVVTLLEMVAICTVDIVLVQTMESLVHIPDIAGMNKCEELQSFEVREKEN
jgi:hypothetical protein